MSQVPESAEKRRKNGSSDEFVHIFVERGNFEVATIVLHKHN